MPDAVTAPRLHPGLVRAAIGGMGFSSYLAASAMTWRLEAAAWSTTAIGAALLVASLAYMLGVWRLAPLGDRWGRVPLMIAGQAAMLLGSLAIAAGPALCAAGGITICFLGCALYFPNAAACANDGGSAAGTPLHRVVAGYNLGWSLGNTLGFAAALLLAGSGAAAAALVAGGVAVAFAVAALPAWRMPLRNADAGGSAVAEPGLQRLLWAGRWGILVVCLANFALVGLTLAALRDDSGLLALGADLREAAARRLQSSLLLHYALGYCLGFAILGAWSGWVLRPLRLLAWCSLMGIGAGALAAVAWCGWTSVPSLAACGLLLGLGFAGFYDASLYYALRSAGSARSAGLHESFLGLGNALGPALAGTFLSAWAGRGAGPGLAGLGIFVLICVLLAIAGHLLCVAPLLRRNRQATPTP